MIPQWVHAARNKTNNNMTYYQWLPSLMHWRNVDYMEAHLTRCVAQPNVKTQLAFTFEQLKLQLIREDDPHPLVARIVLRENLCNQLIVIVCEDVRRPTMQGYMVLDVDANCAITGVTRVQTMGYVETPQSPE